VCALMRVCAYVSVRACVSVCLRERKGVCARVRVCVYVFVRACTRVLMFVHVCVWVCEL